MYSHDLRKRLNRINLMVSVSLIVAKVIYLAVIVTKLMPLS